MKLHTMSLPTWRLAILWLLFIHICPLNAGNKHSLLYFNANNPSSPIIIVIDPGHGGKDNGCLGKNQIEKNINLRVARELEYILERDNPNIEVILTRRTDEFISLTERVRIANDNRASLFISIHCNSINIPSVSGSETYVAGLDLINHDQGDHHHHHHNHGSLQEDLSHLSSLPYAEKMVVMKESLDLAANLDESLGIRLPYKNRGVKEAGFKVLKYLNMPGSLVEVGYLSNPTQENYIGSDTGILEIALSLNDGIMNFLEKSNYRVTRNYFPSEINLSQSYSSINTIFSVKLEESIDKPIAYLDRKWDKLESVQITKKGNNYIYHTGNYLTEDAAKLSLAYLRSIGFQELSIIRIDVDQ